ncbi:MAG: ABC transporter ATP-binding protein [Spirochaetaceae bacterium]|nr:ABC transporter ATP-binding protein [Spirochaetaceae bacterium]
MKLDIKNVSKNFGTVEALKDVSMSFETGHIYALLGRNGAGKSTLMNIITKRIFQSSGNIYLDGEILESDECLSKIYLMSEANYFGNIRVSEAIKTTKLFDESFDDKEALSLSKSFKLEVSQRIPKLSTGYASIFKLIMALCSSSTFVLFDEPILGLDANHRSVFYKLLLSKFAQKNEEVCYIISTHLIEEVSGLIERAIIIKNGEIVVDGMVETLLKNALSVSGKLEDIKLACNRARILSIDTVGLVSSAVVIGEVIDNGNIEINSVDLQTLFIELTNEGGF